jgi:hypothetical protein
MQKILTRVTVIRSEIINKILLQEKSDIRLKHLDKECPATRYFRHRKIGAYVHTQVSAASMWECQSPLAWMWAHGIPSYNCTKHAIGARMLLIFFKDTSNE